MKRQLYIIIALLLMTALTAGAQERYQFSATVKPLIKTVWGQGDPFNKVCPKTVVDGKVGHVKVGCIPVAMGQVMNYYHHPQMAPDKTFAYEWQKMFTDADDNITTDQLFAVAKLLNDCGTSAYTNYGEERSSTDLRQMVIALKRHYGYSRYMSLVFRQDYSAKEWHQLVEEELQAGRPIIVSAAQKTADGKHKRHAFIIDGCKGGKVHVNFGWKGKDDGYYYLDNLNGYTEQQRMLTGIAPETTLPAIREITVTQPGTLSTHDLSHDRHVRIQGELNADDFAYLRQQAGHKGHLSSIDLSQATVSALPDSAFCECPSLVYVSLPRTVTTLPKGTFTRCAFLNYVDFPENLESIGNHAFAGCNNLIGITLPTGLRRIAPNAFNSCKSLTEITVPATVQFIGNYAFGNCQRLAKLHLPEHVEHIGKEITRDCPFLK